MGNADKLSDKLRVSSIATMAKAKTVDHRERAEALRKEGVEEIAPATSLYRRTLNHATIMQLFQNHITALDTAESRMAPRDFCRYLALKALLPNASDPARKQFRSLFTNYYGLNAGGLRDEFKDRFFKILFDGKVIVKGQPDYPTILNELSIIPRTKGDCAMPFSFVSKLVAIHYEASPIYDRHVLNFFKRKAPTAATPKDERIKWYVDFLNEVATDYTAWAKDMRVTPILGRFKARDQRLAQCNNIRLIDFLVWKVGNQKLL